MQEIEGKKTYSHQEYRRAKIAHVVTAKKQEDFYFNGKRISKENADQITTNYMKSKGIEQ